MKNILLILILMAGTLFAQTNISEGPVRTAIDGYAARVNDRIITYGEIRESMAPYMQQIFEHFQGEELAEQIQKAMLNSREALIEEFLILEEAKERGLLLPDAAIDEEVDRLIQLRFDGDRAGLNRALAERRITFEEWRADVADQITLRVYYTREVVRHVSVPAEAVEALYEKNKESYLVPFKVKFSAILINKGKTDEDRTVKKQQVDDVLQKLRGGVDFAKTAKEVSEGIRANDGGAFPWSDPENIRPELRPSLYSVQTGQISDLIETDEEFYIIKIEERREEGYVAIDDVRDQIEADLLAIEEQHLHKELIDRLAERHLVVRY